MSAPITFVVPGDVDDPGVASGGNVYDLRMCEHLPARYVPVPGQWPMAEPIARANLAESLAVLPDGALVVVDGLVACGSRSWCTCRWRTRPGSTPWSPPSWTPASG